MRLIFVHGSGGYGGLFKHQLAEFPFAEAPDLPGHPEGRARESVEEYRDWLRSYIKDREYRDVVIGGHSLGGAIVISYALAYPEDLKGIILIGTGARLRVHPDYLSACEEAMKGRTERWMKWMEDATKNLPREEREKIIKKRVEIGPEVMLKDLLACDRFDYMNKVGGIRVPALIICGSSDIMTPPKYADYLEREIKGSRKRIIEGAGHLVILEKPEEVNREIKEFIKTLEGGKV